MTEYFDVLDQHGNKLGKTQAKGSPMAPGEYYLGVHVYIYNGDKEFLMHQRSMDKAFRPGGWETVLEHAVAGETSAETARRGVQEEMGLDIPLDVFGQYEKVVVDSYRTLYQHILHVYVVAYDFDIGQVVIQPSEVMDCRAFSYEEMVAHVQQMDYRPQDYRDAVLGLMGQI